MQVFPHHEHRLLRRLSHQPGNQRFLGLLLLPLGTELQGRIILGMGQRQQDRQQWQHLRHGCACAPQGLLQPDTLHLWCLLPARPHQPLEVLDHRVQSALLIIGRTAEDETHSLVGPHGFIQFPH